MWKEGSAYYTVPLDVTIDQIKKNRIKPQEINHKMKQEPSITTGSQQSPTHQAYASNERVQVRDNQSNVAPEMDFNYKRHLDPGAKKNNLYASRLDKMLITNPKNRPASRSNVRLAHSQSIYAYTNNPICITGKQSTCTRQMSTNPVTGVGTRKGSIETDIRNLRLNQNSELGHVQDVELNTPVRASRTRTTRVSVASKRPSTFFRTIGREHGPKQSSLNRPDEGDFFSLTYHPEKSCNQTVFLNEEEDRVQKFAETNKSKAATRNDMINFHQTDNPENKHYHRDAKRQQDELIVKMALFKDIKRNSTNLARRNHIIRNRHSTGLVGGDSPEKQHVAKVFVKKKESLTKRKEGFDAVMQSRFQVQLSMGGVSSNMTGIESKFTRHEKEIEVSQRFKTKRKASFEPPLAKQCPKHKVATPQRTAVKSLIFGYEMEPATIPYEGWKSDPPNELGKSPHPHKRATMEYRPFDLINFQAPNANKFLT